MSIEDNVGNIFTCRIVQRGRRQWLVTNTEPIRRLYYLPGGALIRFTYLGGARFRFCIPMDPCRAAGYGSAINLGNQWNLDNGYYNDSESDSF